MARAPESVATTAGSSWVDRGACVGEDVELFFSLDENDIRTALSICARCPVRDECYAQAMAWREAFGVWGGTTEVERRRVFRAQRGQDRRQDPHAA